MCNISSFTHGGLGVFEFWVLQETDKPISKNEIKEEKMGNFLKNGECELGSY